MVNFVGATSLNLTGKLEKHRVADALPLSNPRASLEARVRHHGCVSSHHRPLHARVVRWRRAFAAVDSAREPCRRPRLGFFFRVWTGTEASRDRRATDATVKPPADAAAVVRARHPSVSGLAVFRGRRRRPFRATFPRHPTPLGKYRVFAAWRIGAAERSRDPTRASLVASRSPPSDRPRLSAELSTRHLSSTAPSPPSERRADLRRPLSTSRFSSRAGSGLKVHELRKKSRVTCSTSSRS